MGITKKLENMFAAAAFAEAGEHETAREILKENETRKTDRKSASKKARKEMRAPGIKR